MPRGDGTGPMGMGPMTGRAAGYCAGYGMPGFMNPIPGRGFWGGGGFGRRGGGRGWRHWYYATGMPGWARAGWAPAWGVPYGAPFAAPFAPQMTQASGGVPYGAPFAPPFAPQMTQEQTVEVLKGQAEYFEKALEDIKKQIEELAAGKKPE